MRVPIILRAATCCILVLVLALVQSLAGVARAAVEPTLTERLGLRDFYDSTGGVTSWTRKWDTNTEPCEGGWYGVVCDPRGHIIEFQLSRNKLYGTLPASFATSFPYLQKLDLSNNLLTGSLPSTFASFPVLTHLDLSNNRFLGDIDDSLWAIPSLEYVATTGNEDLQKVPPTKLTHLYGTEGVSKVVLLIDEL